MAYKLVRECIRMTARAAVGFLVAASAFSAQGAEIRPLLKAGLDLGGDKMLTVVFDDGDTQDIKANDGFYLGGGFAVIDAARRMEYHLTAAFKYGVIAAENGDVEWTRFPLEALVFYRFPRIRVGGGLTYHVSPTVETSGAVGGRYTILEYDAKDAFSGSAKSNGFGISFSMSF
jgi:hypothetical protein